ncbi:MAG: efflux RND transporter periplasmic adaptor subunit [Bacteroidia bacterium]|nr:efflux RND transporter periplasmic adaptor subunit [Bacteroidota bacterium]MBP9082476.1 efflux RND transporter periplasmic adaptor subunit [Bacteroidia bacterium]MBK7968274.1 efflux RND transporter periplasmic adaptor subunit [Bacteroidota bacterium]MBK8414395.1 efflux RND transporter periplasmic adaptor subunit [Bacteroidota bacterium]MBK8873303.1 efflux RND transporter periplasmic adaptor subunit [Bacteroidota bacterium]
MRRGIIYLLILAVVLTGIKLIFFPKKDTTAGMGQGSGKGKSAIAVNGIIVAGEGLEEQITSTGTILANEAAELRAEVSGKIINLNIVEGSKVSKGMLLVKINDADLQASLSKLESQLKLNETKAGRLNQLLTLNGISKEEFEELQNTLDANKADVKFLKAQIEKTEIRAPFDGVIGLRTVSEGSYVSTDKVIATLQQINPVKIDFSLPEKYSSRIKSGGSISFTVEGNKETFKGTIYAIEPKIEAATRTVNIRARCDNSDASLLPGSFAKIQLVLDKTDKALMIPTQAVIPVLKGKKVFVTQNGIAVSRMIDTGVRTESQIEVSEGLMAGDTVLVTGIMQLRDSVPVKVSINQVTPK